MTEEVDEILQGIGKGADKLRTEMDTFWDDYPREKNEILRLYVEGMESLVDGIIGADLDSGELEELMDKLGKELS
ncbi:hypothetical protein ACFLRF_06485 [Candidatus Altiarchaeota archaeon]